MAVKLVIHILIISVIVCFFGLNYDTKVDIKFWFNEQLTLTDVRLFTALAASYLLGLFTFIPFTILKKLKKRKNKEKKEIIKPQNENE